MTASDRPSGASSTRTPHPVPPGFFAADAAGIPLRAIFDIAGGPDGDTQSERALNIAQACLSSWLRHAHFGDLEIAPSEEEFARVEARRRQVFLEVAAVLATVEAVQRRSTWS